MNVELNNNESETLNEFARKFVIENRLCNIVVWRIHKTKMDIECVADGIDLILGLC